MKIFIADNYVQLSQQAAEDLILLIAEKKEPIVCTASGDTPAGLYKVLVEKVTKKQLDVSRWKFLGLDEWVGLNGDDEGSCRFHLNNQLFDPLQIVKDHIVFFDGRATDLDAACGAVEDFIQQQGGIDVAIVGLGMNGHIGMNEPGTPPGIRSHVSTLALITKNTGQKYFKTQQQLNEGITAGLGTLMDAKHIMLLISGPHKAAIVQQVIEGEITEKIPGSLFRHHPGLSIYLDKEAAQFYRHEK